MDSYFALKNELTATEPVKYLLYCHLKGYQFKRLFLNPTEIRGNIKRPPANCCPSCWADWPLDRRYKADKQLLLRCGHSKQKIFKIVQNVLSQCNKMQSMQLNNFIESRDVTKWLKGNAIETGRRLSPSSMVIIWPYW